MRRIYYGWWILASSAVIVYLFGTVLFGFPAYYAALISTFGWTAISHEPPTRILLFFLSPNL